MMIFCPWLGCVCRCEGERSVLGVFLGGGSFKFFQGFVTVSISREISKEKNENYFKTSILGIVLWHSPFQWWFSNVEHWISGLLEYQLFMRWAVKQLNSSPLRSWNVFRDVPLVQPLWREILAAAAWNVGWELQGVPCTPKSQQHRHAGGLQLSKSAKGRPFTAQQCLSTFFF